MEHCFLTGDCHHDDNDDNEPNSRIRETFRYISYEIPNF